MGNAMDGPNGCQFQPVCPLMGGGRVAIRTAQELSLDSPFEFCGGFLGESRGKNARRI
jgi:hypothetical protein